MDNVKYTVFQKTYQTYLAVMLDAIKHVVGVNFVFKLGAHLRPTAAARQYELHRSWAVAF